MWNIKDMSILVISGATGIVTKILKKNLEAIPGKHSIHSLQQTAVLATSHIILKVLQYDTWSLSGGDHSWFKRRSTGKKRPATRNNSSSRNYYYYYYYYYYY
jgi:putative hemolysin